MAKFGLGFMEKPGTPFARIEAAGWVACLVGGLVVMTASSWLDAPMYPVPMTMQTFAVMVIVGLAGMRLSAAIVLVWLALAAAGLPLLADGEGGLDALTGPTSGYLGGFLLAALACGRLAENPMMRGWLAMTLMFVFGHALILGLGWARLALLIGPLDALRGGVTPFLAGAAVKSVLAALTVKGISAAMARRASAARPR